MNKINAPKIINGRKEINAPSTPESLPPPDISTSTPSKPTETAFPRNISSKEEDVSFRDITGSTWSFK